LQLGLCVGNLLAQIVLSPASHVLHARERGAQVQDLVPQPTLTLLCLALGRLQLCVQLLILFMVTSFYF